MSIYEKIKGMNEDEMAKFFFERFCAVAEAEWGVDMDFPTETSIKNWLKGGAK